MCVSRMGSRGRHSERRCVGRTSATGTAPRAAPRETDTTDGDGARSSGSDAAQHVASPDGVTVPLALVEL